MRESQPRKKSPRAPSMTLEEAVDRVRRVYERERLHPAPTDVVAQHLGYKGASNGAALQTLASIRYFGLVERPKDGYLAVSKDFERFQYAPDEQQKRALLIGFLRTPPLYADLLDKYESALPSEANLKFELIERGFSPISAESALSSFRRSVDYANYYERLADAGEISNPRIESVESVEVDYDGIDDESEQEAQLRYPRSPASVIPEPGAKLLGALQFSFPVDETADKIPVRLPGGRKAWLLIPSPFFASDKVRLKAQIDLLLTQDEEDELE